MPYPLKSSRPTIPAARIKNGSGIFLKLSSPKVVRAIETVCRSYGGVPLADGTAVRGCGCVAMITPGPLVITWGRLSSTASLAIY